MDRVTLYTYNGKQNEKAYIEIEPILVGPLVVAADNGMAPPQVGAATKPKFLVNLQEVPDFTHYVLLDFTFPSGTDAGAEYRITISDSTGNQWNDIPSVKAHTLQRQFKFNIIP